MPLPRLVQRDFNQFSGYSMPTKFVGHISAIQNYVLSFDKVAHRRQTAIAHPRCKALPSNIVRDRR